MSLHLKITDHGEGHSVSHSVAGSEICLWWLLVSVTIGFDVGMDDVLGGC